jgi:Tfp pilus assembly protein PilX
MQKSQSGAKGFAILVGVMFAIVLALMAIAVIFSPHHRI